MKLNRDFLMGAAVAAALIVPLTVGLGAARAQTGATQASRIQMGTTSANLGAQLSSHWQSMLDQHQQMVEAQDSDNTRLGELIGAVEASASDQSRLTAAADLAAELARQEIDRRRNSLYSLDGMMSQMAMMGRLQGWMSDQLYQNSMTMVGGMQNGKMNSGMQSGNDTDNANGGQGGSMHNHGGNMHNGSGGGGMYGGGMHH